MERTTRNQWDRPGAARGFTLIEVMIALAIFSIGLLAVYSMQISSVRGNAVARDLSDNVSIASARAEALIALPYEDADLVAGAHPASADPTANLKEIDGIDNDQDGVVDESGETGYMSVEWTVVDECLGADFAGHKCIEVRVISAIKAGRQRDVRVSFIKTNSL